MRFLMMHKNDPDTETGKPRPSNSFTRWVRSSASTLEQAD